MSAPKEASKETKEKLNQVMKDLTSKFITKTSAQLGSRLPEICKQYEKVKDTVGHSLNHLMSKLERCSHKLSKATGKLCGTDNTRLIKLARVTYPARSINAEKTYVQTDMRCQDMKDLEEKLAKYSAKCKSLKQELTQAIQEITKLKEQIKAEKRKQCSRAEMERHDEIKKMVGEVSKYLENSKTQADEVKRAFANSLESLRSQTPQRKLKELMLETIHNQYRLLVVCLIIIGISLIALSVRSATK